MGVPKVSVILICYNQESFVAEALNSALNQQYPDFEVIIADDCSTDTTSKVIDSVLDIHPQSNKAFRVRADKNLGISGNWNRALEHATGEYIIGMAGDDVSLPGRLRAIMEVFRAHSGVFAVVSQATVIDASGRTIKSGFESSDRSSGQLKRCLEVSGYNFWSGAPVIGASAAYHSDLFKLFGPLTAGKSEDNSYIYRALLLGSIYYLPVPLVLWRWHGGNASFGAEISNQSPEVWLARSISNKKDALVNCTQYIVDAEKAYSIGVISKERLDEERRKIDYLEKLLRVSLASEDPCYSLKYLLKAILDHLVAERFKIRSLKFALRSLIRPFLPLYIRWRIARPTC